MTHLPLHDPHRITASGGRWWTVAAWLAFIGFAANVLLPAALSIIIGLIEPASDNPGLSLCGGRSSDLPGKTEPVLVARHCPLCTIPVAPLLRPFGFSVPGEIADDPYSPLRTAGLDAPRQRHGPVQARAPPSIA
jgi:hypothetical protein